MPVVIRSKNKDAKPEEIVEKVLKEVGSTLNVRVYNVRPMKSGGAVLRTPSVAEINKVVANLKFHEAGLTVEKNEDRGVRLAVHEVHPELSVAEFMDGLVELNLKKQVIPAVIKRVRLASRPWSAESCQQMVVNELPSCQTTVVIGTCRSTTAAPNAESRMTYAGCAEPKCLPSVHLMMSMSCPAYAMRVARNHSRH